MKMENGKGYTYELRQGSWLNKWMCSSVKEEPWHSTPACYSFSYQVGMELDEENFPVRRQFLEESPFAKEENCPDCESVWFPFETDRVEKSGFWKLPTQLTFGAELILEAPREGSYPFSLLICGGAKIFINGQKQAQCFPYLRNTETKTELALTLDKGKNKIYVLINELAERNTQFYFKLRYEGQETLFASLPVTVNAERLERMRRLLDGVYLKDFSFHTPEFDLFFAEPLAESVEAVLRMRFQNAHTKTPARQRTVVLEEGALSVPVGDLVPGRVGLAALTLQIREGDICLERTLQFEYYEESVMQERLPTVRERKEQALAFAAEYGVGNLAKMFVLRRLGKRDPLEQEIWDSELAGIRNREDCADFKIPILFHVLSSALYGREEKEEIKQALLGFRYWIDEPGNDVMWFFSENHTLLFFTAEYLAGSLFPEERFSNSGMTGEEHQRKAKGLLKMWFAHFFAQGFSEWNSPVYIPIDMIGLFALYDFAAEKEIQELARQALDRTFTIIGKNSFHGIFAAASARIYFKNLIGRRTGEATAVNYIACGEGYLGHHTACTVMFALSGYEPPREVLEHYRIPAEGQATESTEGGVKLYSYRTPDYIIASAPDCSAGRPGEQEHVIQLMVGDCDTQIWINHPGEAAYFGEGRPGYFAGNGTLPLVKQEKNRLTAKFHLLDQEVKYTHAFCPIKRFDCFQKEEKWAYLKKGTVCVAIYAENGIEATSDGPLKDYELISYGRDNLWKIIVEEESVYGSFESFIKNVS